MPNFHIPTSFKIKDGSTDSHQTFVVGPLERGYGITIGNALRRVLLSSMPGAAITSVRMDNVLHEFATIEGVKEDVTDIVLNLKGVRFKLLESNPDKVQLTLKGPHNFTAKDINNGEDQFEILNPDHHIATLNDSAELSIELRIQRGRGYVPADQNKLPDYPIGTIFIDSIFSPVVRATHEVIQLQGAEDEDLEMLELTVETDGSIPPQEAVNYAAKMLIDHVRIFVTEDIKLITEPESEIDEEVLRIRNELKRSIDELELSVRSYNCLQAAEIKNIADLVSKEEQEMLRYKNFGRKSLTELNDKLAELGLHFGMDIDKYMAEE
ncbi:MAG: DNA-directed RNA polymerase subunit alpha [Candidatus Marinimicrobia bacterium]|nr:DNA-directed RNA polymerase subunit alpha [Candidatus Neomarinimicrobiota bacterium]MCF7851479.1 DNA-directed RNA polymerase subunit alpha [Candidatus Neomarinimicrobiota bacterium]MCF7904738.1 DNA-directed RNA polymerase subunit alpha [Candidatus Neomarinimicrobiota bacterium]